MLREFSNYLQMLSKSQNTITSYCRDVTLFLKWCEDSFGGSPDCLYRANVQEYISYMQNLAHYCPKTVNRHPSSLRSYNDWLIESGQQSDIVVLKNDFMKMQRQYASLSTVTKKDVEAFR